MMLSNDVQSHKIKQEIECIGCREKFSMPALLTEHLEFVGNSKSSILAANALRRIIAPSSTTSNSLDTSFTKYLSASC